MSEDDQPPTPEPGEAGSGKSVWGYTVPKWDEDLYKYELSDDELHNDG